MWLSSVNVKASANFTNAIKSLNQHWHTPNCLALLTIWIISLLLSIRIHTVLHIAQQHAFYRLRCKMTSVGVASSMSGDSEQNIRQKSTPCTRYKLGPWFDDRYLHAKAEAVERHCKQDD